jgi:hypothetical protein
MMKPQNTVMNEILEIVALAPGCHVTYVAQFLPDVTSREIYYTLRFLNQKGQLDLKMDREDGLTVTPSPRLFN